MADLADLVTRAAAEAPDRAALVEAAGRALTWAELEDEVGRLATGLGAAGIVAGHRVLLALGNRLEFVTTYLAILRAQAVAVPVNPRRASTSWPGCSPTRGPGSRSPTRLDAARGPGRAGAGDPGAGRPRGRHGVRARGAVARGRPDRGRGPRRDRPVPGSARSRTCGPSRPGPVPPLPDPEKLAVLLYTAGTSGRPRAAMLTHRAMLANLEQVARVEPPMIRADDVVLAVLPLFHVYGLNAVLGGAVRHGATVVLQERFDAQGTLDLVAARGCTMVPLAPAVFRPWLALPDLRSNGCRPCAWCCPARRRCPATSWRSSRSAPGSRCTRATASPRPRRW